MWCGCGKGRAGARVVREIWIPWLRVWDARGEAGRVRMFSKARGVEERKIDGSCPYLCVKSVEEDDEGKT